MTDQPSQNQRESRYTPAARQSAVAQEHLFGAERAKTFVDAVVAIAMTLLILPLMESVAAAGGTGETAAEWVGGHGGQLFAFVLSFAVIATPGDAARAPRGASQ